ncbi:MAG: hypothetical protein D6732_20280, partial [Methanobacteriota archaeon]
NIKVMVDKNGLTAISHENFMSGKIGYPVWYVLIMILFCSIFAAIVLFFIDTLIYSLVDRK